MTRGNHCLMEKVFGRVRCLFRDQRIQGSGRIGLDQTAYLSGHPNDGVQSRFGGNFWRLSPAFHQK